jgi:hypothetical protein
LPKNWGGHVRDSDAHEEEYDKKKKRGYKFHTNYLRGPPPKPTPQSVAAAHRVIEAGKHYPGADIVSKWLAMPTAPSPPPRAASTSSSLASPGSYFAMSPSAWSPSAWSPSAWSPSAWSPYTAATTPALSPSVGSAAGGSSRAPSTAPAPPAPPGRVRKRKEAPDTDGPGPGKTRKVTKKKAKESGARCDEGRLARTRAVPWLTISAGPPPATGGIAGAPPAQASRPIAPLRGSSSGSAGTTPRATHAPVDRPTHVVEAQPTVGVSVAPLTQRVPGDTEGAFSKPRLPWKQKASAASSATGYNHGGGGQSPALFYFIRELLLTSPLAPHLNTKVPKPATTAAAYSEPAGRAQPKAASVQTDSGVPHAVASKKLATHGISGATSVPLDASEVGALLARGASTKTSRSHSSSTAPTRAAVYVPPGALTNGASAPSGRVALALPVPLQAPEVDDVGDGADCLDARSSAPSPSPEAGQTADRDAAESEQDEDEDVEHLDALNDDLIAAMADEESEEPSQPTVADENKPSDGDHAAEDDQHQLKTVGSTDDASVISVGVSGDAEHEAATAVEVVAGTGQPDDDADVAGQKQDDVKDGDDTISGDDLFEDDDSDGSIFGGGDSDDSDGSIFGEGDVDATTAGASTGTTQAASGTPSSARDLATTHTTLSVPVAKPVGRALLPKTRGSAAPSLPGKQVVFALSLPGQDQNNT